MGKSAIEWTENSWNPIRARAFEGGMGHYCVKVSPGCKNCYAERMQRRFKNPVRYAAQDRDKVQILLDPARLIEPLRWRKPRLVFVCSMTDLFADFVPDDWLDQMFAVMAMCPQHTFQVLTKRPARMRDYLTALADPVEDRWPAERWGREPRWRVRALRAAKYFAWRYDKTIPHPWPPSPLPNVWLGVSVEDQRRANERVPELLRTPAAVRFLSCEPLLGAVDLGGLTWDAMEWAHALKGVAECPYGAIVTRKEIPSLDWVIAGGESGPGARPMHPDWARSLRDQCVAAGVPFFFKQWGEFVPTHKSTHVRETYGRLAGRLIPDHAVKGQFLACPSEPDEFDGCGNPRFDVMVRVGKKKAGALLDGREWRQFPEAA